MAASAALQPLLAGLALASVYALVAMGFSLVYQASQIFNFAQGALVALAAFLAAAAADGQRLAWPYALAFAVAASVVIGLAVQALLVRPLSRRSPREATLGLIALAAVVGAGLEAAFGSRAWALPAPFATFGWAWGGVTIPGPLLVTAAASWGSILMVALLLRFTPLGLVMSSGPEGQDAARHVGIDVAAMQRLAFAIGGYSAGVGGLLLGLGEGVSPGLGDAALLAIAAAAIGGLGSLRGAIAGALLVGLAQPFAVAYATAETGECAVYLALLALLALRPRGLFARRTSGA